MEIIALLKEALKCETKDLLAEKINRARIVINDSGLVDFSYSGLEKDFRQIEEAKTIDRSVYYIKRLIKTLTEEKTNSINDINLRKWKEYDDILTDSLWLMDKRDNSGNHSAGYWGNFIPQIPNQLIKRYTKKGDIVLDPFLGSATTMIECSRLGRKCIGIEIQKKMADAAGKIPELSTDCKVIRGDSSSDIILKKIKRTGIDSAQLVIMHPPYWDIIKFSKNKADLSNAESLEAFLEMLGKIAENMTKILDSGRYLALIIGDKYSAGELVPLGFLSMQEMLKHGLKLKSIVVKNFEQTLGKRNQKELWRYRALAGGFFVFKHEYIFIFRKE